jgi:hypothetical protein
MTSDDIAALCLDALGASVAKFRAQAATA